jgi:hypothetical protein
MAILVQQNGVIVWTVEGLAATILTRLDFSPGLRSIRRLHLARSENDLVYELTVLTQLWCIPSVFN